MSKENPLEQSALDSLKEMSQAFEDEFAVPSCNYRKSSRLQPKNSLAPWSLPEIQNKNKNTNYLEFKSKRQDSLSDLNSPFLISPSHFSFKNYRSKHAGTDPANTLFLIRELKKARYNNNSSILQQRSKNAQSTAHTQNASILKAEKRESRSKSVIPQFQFHHNTDLQSEHTSLLTEANEANESNKSNESESDSTSPEHISTHNKNNSIWSNKHKEGRPKSGLHTTGNKTKLTLDLRTQNTRNIQNHNQVNKCNITQYQYAADERNSQGFVYARAKNRIKKMHRLCDRSNDNHLSFIHKRNNCDFPVSEQTNLRVRSVLQVRPHNKPVVYYHPNRINYNMAIIQVFFFERAFFLIFCRSRILKTVLKNPRILN